MFCRIAFLLVLALSYLPATAQAELLVTPTRFIFEERTRETSFALVNRGADEATYRISFENYHALPNGAYHPITTPTSPTGEQFATKLLRYSPREVRLKPGETQFVRVMLRLPADLPAGEYRSHLKFTQIPTAAPLRKHEARKPGARRVSFAMVLNYSVSVPVIVRQGATAATVDVANVELEPAVGPKKTLKLTLSRQGNRSVFGNIKVTYRPQKGAEELMVGELNGVSVLTPNEVREVTIGLNWPPEYQAAGLLSITYRNAEDENDYVLAEKKIEL